MRNYEYVVLIRNMLITSRDEWRYTEHGNVFLLLNDDKLMIGEINFTGNNGRT